MINNDFDLSIAQLSLTAPRAEYKCWYSPVEYSEVNQMSLIGYSLKGLLGNWYPVLVKSLGNGWSKSIVLESKVVINFDFRSGAKKSGHLDYPFQSYGPKFVNMHKYAYVQLQ